MKLYNTLGRKLEEFNSISPSHVLLYSCGPTVYSYYHVGNLRNAVFNDTLRRTLEANGYQVSQVMNITDVGHLTSDADEGEDKLEKGARDSGKTVWEVAEHYTEAVKKDMAALNIQPPNGYKGTKDTYARATDFIEEQIGIVKLLLEKDFAYQTQQAIYFDVSKLSTYGELAGQKLDEKEIAARSDVVSDVNKRNPQDFAVWFFTVGHFAEHSMKWASPWGEGFPGWHLECSAIIHATMGDPIDIHTGGVDHIGTHHPNEMAQTEAAFGHKLAKYWIHNEFLLVDGQKMSKSLGNLYTLADVIDKGFHPLALKLLYLQSHYRSQLNFTWDSLSATQNGLLNLWAWADLIHQSTDLKKATSIEEATLVKKIVDSLADDLNTSVALASFSEFSSEYSPNAELLKELDKLFGLRLSGRPDIEQGQKELIKQRESARQSGDWEKADNLRRELEESNIAINDTEKGAIWSRLV